MARTCRTPVGPPSVNVPCVSCREVYLLRLSIWYSHDQPAWPTTHAFGLNTSHRRLEELFLMAMNYHRAWKDGVSGAMTDGIRETQ